jgi:pimeloyl-ACP methyl ester carboxylesterase
MIAKQTGFVESFDGTSIYYEVRGQGKPIVFANGLACGMNQWHKQIKYFSQKYQTIAFDYRGHLNSETPKSHEYLTMDALAQDIQKLCNHLEVEKASFWGHSYGAQVLIRTFDMNPQLFHNMVFVNGFATNPINGMFGLDVVSSAFKVMKDGYEQLPETLSYLWKSIVTNPFAMKLTGWAGGFNLALTSFKDIEIYARGVANIELDVFLSLFEHMMNYDGLSVLERINVPTLIIGGAKDSVTPLKYQKALHTKIKGSELLVVPYGSHCAQLDMPDLVNLRIEKFLNQVRYSPTALTKRTTLSRSHSKS